MDQAELILLFAKIWGGVGALVALAFLSFGIDRLDEDAKGAYVFRPLIVPGVLLIWPLVLWRWYILADGKDDWAKRYKPKRNSHNLFALIMPVLIIGIIAAGLSVRQTWPVNLAPVQLTEPGQ
jgi:hypothetical protein